MIFEVIFKGIQDIPCLKLLNEGKIKISIPIIHGYVEEVEVEETWSWWKNRELLKVV
jgi:hypothetical protein